MKKTRSGFRFLWVVTACALLVSPAGAALQVTDGTPVQGAVMGGVDGAVEVTVTDSRAIIDWATLDTEVGELLKFMGEGAYAVLNRVQQAKRTEFMGNLEASGGHVIIVNPYGIVFGPQSLIEADQFTASSLMIDEQDFLDGNYAFTGSGEMWGEIVNNGTIVTTGQAALIGARVINKGSIMSYEGGILMATGDRVVLGSEGSSVVVEVEGVLPAAGSDMGHIINEGLLATAIEGDIVLAAGDTFAQSLSVGNVGRIRHSGTIIAAGDLEAAALGEVWFAEAAIPGNPTTTVSGDINIKGGAVTLEEDLVAGNDMTIVSRGLVKTRTASLISGGDMSITSGPSKAISVEGGLTSGGDMLLDAGTYIFVQNDMVSGNDMTVRTGSDNTYSTGNLIAEHDINLQTNLELSGGKWTPDADGTMIYEGQKVDARTGTLTAEGWIQKVTAGELHLHGGDPDLAVDLRYSGEGWYDPTVGAGGNIYISGKGDIQIAGDIDATMEGYMPAPPGADFYVMPYDIGGVSIISEEGKIYTEGTDGLNVGIYGYSNDIMDEWIDGEIPVPAGAGVDLPYKDDGGNAQGKAAIVLQSGETLRIGEDAELVAFGYYLPAGDYGEEGLPGVDDRPGVDFLAQDAVIGGWARNQGVPSDIAIYVGSTGGDVVMETLEFGVFAGHPWAEGGWYGLGPATVVLDAADTVSFDGYFMDWLLEEYYYYLDRGDGYEYGDGSPLRLEVCSRRTEWLEQAIAWGTLPFADEPEFMEWVLGADYVLRGAGGSNYPPGGSAWVLEDNSPEPEPVPVAAPLPHFEDPQLKGCPAELAAAASELGTTADELQLLIGSSLAANPNVQACDTCAQLIRAATVLKDFDGSHLAAMNRVFNQLAPADAPLTPETVASIVVAFAELSQQNADYALASAYVDAYAQYAAALDSLGAPVGDPVTFVMNKHGKALMDNANANIRAFVAVRLEQIGG
jgi:filamentous hemagglutinin family protein